MHRDSNAPPQGYSLCSNGSHWLLVSREIDQLEPNIPAMRFLIDDPRGGAMNVRREADWAFVFLVIVLLVTGGLLYYVVNH